MTLEHAMAFLLFATVAAVTPGPSNIMLAAAGANGGVARGLPCLGGVACGMALMIFVVALGLGSLLLAHSLLLTGLKWGGIGLLLWLAWKIATAGQAPGQAPAVVGFWGAAAMQWLNPKSWLVGVSAAGAYLPAETAGATVQAATLAALFLLAALPSCFLWLAGGAAVQRRLRTERARRVCNAVMGGLLAGSMALLLR